MIKIENIFTKLYTKHVQLIYIASKAYLSKQDNGSLIKRHVYVWWPATVSVHRATQSSFSSRATVAWVKRGKPGLNSRPWRYKPFSEVNTALRTAISSAIRFEVRRDSVHSVQSLSRYFAELAIRRRYKPTRQDFQLKIMTIGHQPRKDERRIDHWFTEFNNRGRLSNLKNYQFSTWKSRVFENRIHLYSGLQAGWHASIPHCAPMWCAHHVDVLIKWLR